MGRRLWLTGPAFGLPEDCPVAVLLRDPPLRAVPLPRGGTGMARIASLDQEGDVATVVIEAGRRGEMPDASPARRITLDLLLHRAEGIVSVERIRVETAGADPATLRYREAVSDDDDYDTYTNTLVSTYTTFFDTASVRKRAGS